MKRKLFGGAAQAKAVFAPCTLLTLVKFKLNKVPEPESGVESVEKAEMRKVLVVPAPMTFAVTFQFVAVKPAGDAGVAWKVTTDESKVKSPWKPMRLSEALMVDVVTGSVKLVTLVPTVATGKETVATADGRTRPDDEVSPGSGLARVGVKSPLMSPSVRAL